MGTQSRHFKGIRPWRMNGVSVFPTLIKEENQPPKHIEEFFSILRYAAGKSKPRQRITAMRGYELAC